MIQHPSRRAHGLRGWRTLLACLALLGGCSQLPMSSPATSGAAACRAASLTNPLAGGPDGAGTRSSPLVAGLPGGLGGTGRPASTPAAQEGGLGGTGVVGVVTGFASICVNGLEVEFDQNTPLQRDGQRAQARDLSVGQVVALQAVGQGDRLRATQIAMLDAVVGPIERVDAGTGHVTVMGQAVAVLNAVDIQGLVPGDWVRVSGHRQASGEIRATRVQRVEAGQGRVTGSVTQQTSAGWRVGDTLIARGTAKWPAGLVDGQEVSVQGRWTGTRLEAQEVQLNPTRQAIGGVQEVVLEGYVHGLSGSELQLGYETLTLGAQVRVQGSRRDQLRAGLAVRVRGKLDRDQHFTADRVTVRPDDGRRRGGDDRSGRRGRGGSDDDRDDDADHSGQGSGGGGSDDSGHSGRGGSDDSSGSGSSGSGSSGSGSSGSGSSGSGSSGSGSSGSGSSGSGSSGSGSSGSGSSGSGSSGSGSSGSGSSGSGSSGSGSSGSGSSGKGK
jgi:hypothetical protein